MKKQKKCSGKCGRELPLDAFYAKSDMKDGHVSKCKECLTGDSSNRWAGKAAWVAPPKPPAQRKCMRKQEDGSICGSTENLTKDKNMCKPCKSKANKQYKAGNNDKNKRAFWFREAHANVTMFKPFLIAWNHVTRRLL